MPATNLQIAVRNVNLIALDAWDRADASQQVLDSLTTEVRNTSGANPVHFDMSMTFPWVSEWDTDTVLGQKWEKLNFSVPLRGWSVFDTVRNVDLNRPHVIGRLEQAAASWGAAALRKEASHAMAVFRDDSLLTYDGQNYFDTDHVHPDQVTIYDNIQPMAGIVGNLAQPTVDELSNLIDVARQRLRENDCIESEVIDVAASRANLGIICYSPAYETALDRLRSEKQINATDNRQVGSFRLWRDKKAPASHDNRLTFVDLGSPAKPTVRIVDRDPFTEVWTGEQVKSGYTATGIKWISGHKPAWAHVAVQAR